MIKVDPEALTNQENRGRVWSFFHDKKTGKLKKREAMLIICEPNTGTPSQRQVTV
jgi:hypothetical protein